MKPQRSIAVSAFSLLEMLVATAVLSLMMVFMFNLVGASMRAWESGARGIEGAQAARIGLDRMTTDLRNAVAGAFPVKQMNGTVRTNFLPFFATNNARTLPGQGAGAVAVPGSGMLFAVAPVADATATNGPFSEVGFMVAYLSTDQGISTMGGRRYYLLRHAPFRSGVGAVTEPVNNCFYRGQPNNRWFEEGISTTNRPSIVDNCYQMTLRFASNSAPPGGELQFTDRWTNQTSLPAGVLIGLKVMDAKTAARIAQLRPEGLTSGDLDPASSSEVSQVLRAGTVEVTRFIPFLNSTN
jgi:type II secretory pathway pseudopilin PulG